MKAGIERAQFVLDGGCALTQAKIGAAKMHQPRAEQIVAWAQADGLPNVFDRLIVAAKIVLTVPIT
jgi:hypothetical protein